MNYRSRMEIISQILEVANGSSVTKTNIMYKAFLSYAQLGEYLAVLTENDLLHYYEETHTFKTTEKGVRFLKIYNQMDDLMKGQQQI